MPRSTSMLTEHHPLSGTPIAIDGGKSLSIRRAEDCARFSLRIAVEHAGEAAAAFGCDLPRAIGGMTSSAGKLALCLGPDRSEEHTSELQSLMRISYAVFCLKKKNKQNNTTQYSETHTR